MRAVISMALILCAMTAAADQLKTFTWQAPTEYEDGSPLPVEEIASY